MRQLTGDFGYWFQIPVENALQQAFMHRGAWVHARARATVRMAYILFIHCFPEVLYYNSVHLDYKNELCLEKINFLRPYL